MAVILWQKIEAVVRDPYARWCGRGGVARRPPIPINPKSPSQIGELNGPAADPQRLSDLHRETPA